MKDIPDPLPTEVREANDARPTTVLMHLKVMIALKMEENPPVKLMYI